ncbi:MAG: metallopeptidase family protein [Actinomycetota bacterium]|nr:metallopeptidase family protein [Actinomycetota bacterium]
MSEERFEQLVADALDDLPPELAELIDNLAVFVEDRHPDEPDLLGLYEGVPLTERDGGYGAYGGLVMPDRITLYRLALCEVCEDTDELCEEVVVTVVHEVAHHFGIDDERLHELGWA